jgi:NAD(P)-dependent dehydrogenase (short-subunit alcohol dehydrogenase family)
MGKVVLISGASAGMGKETAIYLAQRKYKVYGSARRMERMQDLTQYGIVPLKMDVTDDRSMKAGVDTILEKEGRIDILINNAGFGAYGAVEDVPIKDAKYQLEVNVFGAARLIQLVLPSMRKQGYGKIVNISSIGGRFATPLGGWYHASKFALEGLSDSLRNEVKQFGIDVIVIEPGGIKTEWGHIAYDNLKKNTVNSVYQTMAEKFAGVFESTLNKNAEPIVIARLIHKAITARNPKTRYTAGYMAKPLILSRKFVSDRLMDKILMSQVK